MNISALAFRFFFTVVAVTTLSQNLPAQLGHWTTLPAPPGMSVVYDIDMYDKNFGVCVGPADSARMFSGVSLTTDGGQNWLDVINDSIAFIPLARSYTVFRAVHVGLRRQRPGV